MKKNQSATGVTEYASKMTGSIRGRLLLTSGLIALVGAGVISPEDVSIPGVGPLPVTNGEVFIALSLLGIYLLVGFLVSWRRDRQVSASAPRPGWGIGTSLHIWFVWLPVLAFFFSLGLVPGIGRELGSRNAQSMRMIFVEPMIDLAHGELHLKDGSEIYQPVSGTVWGDIEHTVEYSLPSESPAQRLRSRKVREWRRRSERSMENLAAWEAGGLPLSERIPQPWNEDHGGWGPAQVVEAIRIFEGIVLRCEEAFEQGLDDAATYETVKEDVGKLTRELRVLIEERLPVSVEQKQEAPN